MRASFLDSIDWQQPWLLPLHAAVAPIMHAADWRRAINTEAAAKGLRNRQGMPIHFVPQADLPADTAYESFIHATGAVPTRDNLHDFFNALVWLTFPDIKVQLNALQSSEIIKLATAPSDISHGSHRGKLRDAATIFDENAALLIVRDTELVDALRDHRWRDVFITRRAAFGRDCEVWLFGHALMEKLVSPYKSITAHAWIVIPNQAYFAMSMQDKRAWIDTQVTRQLMHGMATSDFTPLPVMGVPGWWGNQDNMFYDDVTVFRPKRGINR